MKGSESLGVAGVKGYGCEGPGVVGSRGWVVKGSKSGGV